MHGLSPTTELDMKFQSQAEDDINGNGFVKRCLSPAAVRRCKHFRRFFATQSPLIIPPPNSPKWKIEEFLKWIKIVSKKAWRLAKRISVDEQTTGFQGRHPSKLRITYKRDVMGSSAMLSVMMATLSHSTSATSHHQSSIHPLDYLPSMLE